MVALPSYSILFGSSSKSKLSALRRALIGWDFDQPWLLAKHCSSNSAEIGNEIRWRTNRVSKLESQGSNWIILFKCHFFIYLNRILFQDIKHQLKKSGGQRELIIGVPRCGMVASANKVSLPVTAFEAPLVAKNWAMKI
jgi:hypothetical protein